jgi:hypothetical protein
MHSSSINVQTTLCSQVTVGDCYLMTKQIILSVSLNSMVVMHCIQFWIVEYLSVAIVK